MATFVDASRSPWREVARLCQNAAVFLDSSAAEHLHWAGGVRLLGDCVGVYDLHVDLSPVAKDFIAMAPYCHVVIVVTSFLAGRCSERIAALLSSLQPLECHVFTSLPEAMHAEWIPMPGGEREQGGGWGSEEEEEGEGERYSHYGEFQALMRKWISRESGVRVSVNYLPVFHCEVCPGLVITPPHSPLSPLLPSHVDDLQAKLIGEGETDVPLDHLGQVDFTMLTRELQTQIRAFVWALSDLLGQLDVREDIFSLGHTSRLIANQLATLPEAKTRRKAANYRCSLLLVDRSLDLTSPASHPLDSPITQALSSLPRLPQHSSDVAVDLGMICDVPPGVLVPGCLAQPNSPKAQTLLRTLICSKQKEGLMELSRCLLDCLSQEGLSARLTGRLGRPSAAQLRGFLQLFKGHPGAIESQRAVVQLACAVVEGLEGQRAKHWEELASVEKVCELQLLTLGVGDRDTDSVVKQLTVLTRRQLEGDTASSSPTTLPELLGVAIAMYSMAGDDCLHHAREETELKDILVDLLLMHRDCDLEFIRSLGIGLSDSRVQVLGRMSSVFHVLQGLGQARQQLQMFRTTYSTGHTPLPYRPLLTQLVDTIFDPSRPDLVDVDHAHGHAVTDILKTGFSLFVSSARPRPNNHPLLFLFVVGGVSCAEVRQIRESVASHKSDIQVVIGGTRLLTPNDVTTQVFCTDTFRPAM